MGGPRPPWHRRDRVVDVVVALVALAASYAGAPPTPGDFGPPDAAVAMPIVVLLVAGAAALLLRRFWPVAVWCVTAVISVASGSVADDAGRGLPLAAAALYAVARYAGRRAALSAVALTTGAAVVGLVVIDRFDAATDPRVYAGFAFCGLAAALGDAARVNRLLLDDAQERARVAEASRDDEARRRVAEERLRISRDLHDVVGHHLAVVTVQAGLAGHVWDSDPATGRKALREAIDASASALRQTSELVGLLRGAADDPARPLPSFEGVGELVASLRAAGLEVRWTHDGPGVPAGWASGTHAYRIVQEGLTNAARHGRGPVSLTTSVVGDTLTVQISNGLTLGPPTGEAEASSPLTAGHGLVMMRERVSLVGGTFAAGRVADRFTIRAELPGAGPR